MHPVFMAIPLMTSTDTNTHEGKVERFAHNMRKIPRRALKCEIYGTVTVVVDRSHALNIFRKLFPAIRDSECYTALCILQGRLDDNGGVS